MFAITHTHNHLKNPSSSPAVQDSGSRIDEIGQPQSGGSARNSYNINNAQYSSGASRLSQPAYPEFDHRASVSTSSTHSSHPRAPQSNVNINLDSPLTTVHQLQEYNHPSQKHPLGSVLSSPPSSPISPSLSSSIPQFQAGAVEYARQACNNIPVSGFDRMSSPNSLTSYPDSLNSGKPESGYENTSAPSQHKRKIMFLNTTTTTTTSTTTVSVDVDVAGDFYSPNPPFSGASPHPSQLLSSQLNELTLNNTPKSASIQPVDYHQELGAHHHHEHDSHLRNRGNSYNHNIRFPAASTATAAVGEVNSSCENQNIEGDRYRRVVNPMPMAENIVRGHVESGSNQARYDQNYGKLPAAIPFHGSDIPGVDKTYGSTSTTNPYTSLASTPTGSYHRAKRVGDCQAYSNTNHEKFERNIHGLGGNIPPNGDRLRRENLHDAVCGIGMDSELQAGGYSKSTIAISRTDLVSSGVLTAGSSSVRATEVQPPGERHGTAVNCAEDSNKSWDPDPRVAAEHAYDTKNRSIYRNSSPLNAQDRWLQLMQFQDGERRRAEEIWREEEEEKAERLRNEKRRFTSNRDIMSELGASSAIPELPDLEPPPPPQYSSIIKPGEIGLRVESQDVHELEAEYNSGRRHTVPKPAQHQGHGQHLTNRNNGRGSYHESSRSATIATTRTASTTTTSSNSSVAGSAAICEPAIASSAMNLVPTAIFTPLHYRSHHDGSSSYMTTSQKTVSLVSSSSTSSSYTRSANNEKSRVSAVGRGVQSMHPANPRPHSSDSGVFYELPGESAGTSRNGSTSGSGDRHRIGY